MELTIIITGHMYILSKELTTKKIEKLEDEGYRKGF